MVKKEEKLFCESSGSDKFYILRIEQNDEGLFTVNFEYGKVGLKIGGGTKTNQPVDWEEAKKLYAEILEEKIAKGYYKDLNESSNCIDILPAVNGQSDNIEVLSKDDKIKEKIKSKL